MGSMNDTKNNTETFAFQAEISQLMSLIINTFYSNKSIFLRELISNSSDALDKIRYQGLTDKSALETELNLRIHLIPDPENNQLHIEDSGVGMTKADLINNLGTIAKSGTKSFMEALSSGADMSLIGQFGVGFYSSFLVADTVSVTTKHNDDDEYTWSSSAGGSFTITQDETTTLKRGTRISLHLKEEHLEFLEISEIKNLVKKHSEFINYPISLMMEKEREIEDDTPVESTTDSATTEDVDATDSATTEDVDATEAVSELESDKEGILEEVDETQETMNKPKKMEKYNELEVINTNKPIWIRDTESVTEEEYGTFYKGISGDWEEHLAVSHFKAEGQIEFKGILFVPKRAPMEFFNKENKNNIKLYVRRVFIMDKCDELIPDWLSFMKGVIDSEDLPLNISREMLQQSRVIKIMRKNIIKRSIELFQDLEKDDTKYETFYEHFSKNIKLGIHEDNSNRDKLSKLLRYNSYRNEKSISLESYISEMPENQNEIYYITGETHDKVKNSSFVEGVVKAGYDVLFLTDPIDEYVIQKLTEYDGKKLVSITKDDFKLPETDEDKKTHTENETEFNETCEKIKEILKDRCEKVILSGRLTDAPCCVVTGQHGWSANMERIMKVQALGDKTSFNYMTSKKTLEINPGHSIIKELRSKLSSQDETSKKINSDLVNLMFDTSLIESGFSIENTHIFSKRIFNMLELGMGLELDINDGLEEKDSNTAENTEVKTPPALDEVTNMEEMENVD